MAERAPAAIEAVLDGRGPSQIADHGADCCAVARTWLVRLDASFHRGRGRDAPPAWIARRFTPQTTRERLHWCEIPRGPALDRGAAAALALVLWRGRCEDVRAVELVESRDGAKPAGAGGELVHRDAVGRTRDGRLEIWDASDGAWLPAPSGAGGPATLSLRVAGDTPATLRWGDQRLAAGAWTSLPAD